MLSFQRKSLSFESALSYLQAFIGNSNTFLWKRSCLLEHLNSLCEVNGVLHPFPNAVLSEKITFLWKCVKPLTRIQEKFTCVSLKEKQSVPTLQFTVRSEWSVASLSKCCPFRENHSLLKLPEETYKHSEETHICFFERESLFQQFNSLSEVNGVVLHILNAVVSEKITFLWKCLKLISSIHKKLTSVSLKEKQSVPTLQSTVRSEWSVASLSICSPFRENHSLLKLP